MTTKTRIFERHSDMEHADSLADYLPPGLMFEGAREENSNLRRLLHGLSGELVEAEDLLKQYSENVLPDRTILLLDEWESALGIPGGCFTGLGSDLERRTAILGKLAANGVQTAEDIIAMGAIFGVSINVIPGINEYPGPLFSSEKEARFSTIIEMVSVSVNRFPLTFPIVFGDPIFGFLECLFSKLKPANCQNIYREI